MDRWIQMRTNLITDPKTSIVINRIGERPVVAYGALFLFWAIAFEHAKMLPAGEDGEGDAYVEHTEEMLDTAVQVPGFCKAMVAAGWMRIEEDCVVIPRYSKYLGRMARTITERERKRKVMREARQNGTAGAPDKPATAMVLPESSRPNPPEPAIVGLLQRMGISERNAAKLARQPDLTAHDCMLVWSAVRAEKSARSRPGLLYSILESGDFDRSRTLKPSDLITAIKEKVIHTVNGHAAGDLEWSKEGDKPGFRSIRDRRLILEWNKDIKPEVT